MIIGVGGEYGLMRMSMLANWTTATIFLLPGSGGFCNTYWNDFFKNIHQVDAFTQEEQNQILQCPYLNEKNDNYHIKVVDILKIVSKEKPPPQNNNTIITHNTITIPDFLKTLEGYHWVLLFGLFLLE